MANLIDPIFKFFDWIYDIWAVIDRPLIQGFDGAVVSVADILFGFLVLSFIVTVFWKGAKT